MLNRVLFSGLLCGFAALLSDELYSRIKARIREKKFREYQKAYFEGFNYGWDSYEKTHMHEMEFERKLNEVRCNNCFYKRSKE